MDLLDETIRVNIDFNQAINYISNSKKEEGIKNLLDVIESINHIVKSLK